MERQTEQEHIGSIKISKHNVWEKMRPSDFEAKGNKSMDGQIIEFDPPLYVNGYDKERKEKNKDGKIITVMPCFPAVRTKQPVGRFMKVSGGFGSSFACMGRMIIGKYYETLDDVENNEPINDGGKHEWGGNTKEYPAWVCVKVSK